LDHAISHAHVALYTNDSDAGRGGAREGRIV